MALTVEEIRILMIEKLAGSIEPADDVLVSQLIKDDAVIREMWQQLTTEISRAECEGFVIQVDDQENWNRLQSLLGDAPASKVRRPFKKLLAAASILGFVAIAYWLLRTDKPPRHIAAVSATTTIIKSPTLTLSNNQVVELTGDEDKKFKIPNGVLETTGRTLTYTITGDDDGSWTLTVPPGTDYKVRLSDGSEVWLNAATNLKFQPALKGKNRDVYIQGEAFFKVAKNTLRPFIVHAATTDVLVTGTVFNVNSYNADRIQTALVEGAVTLRHQHAPEVKLRPGFEAGFVNTGFEMHPFDTLEVLSWMRGIYYFRNTPMNELSAVIKRWYDVDAEFSHSAVGLKTFTGELRRNDSLSVFLEHLNLSGEIQGTFNNGRLIFK
jgi:transmembrane sensor